MNTVRAHIRETIELPGNQVESFNVAQVNRPFTRQYALYYYDDKDERFWLRDISDISAYPNVCKVDELSAKWQQIKELGGVPSDEMITQIEDASTFYVYFPTAEPFYYQFGDCEGMCAIAMDLPKRAGSLAQYILDQVGTHEFYRFCIEWGQFLGNMFDKLDPDKVMFIEYTDNFCDWLQDPSKEFVHSAEALLQGGYTIVSNWLKEQ